MREKEERKRLEKRVRGVEDEEDGGDDEKGGLERNAGMVSGER